MDAQRHTLAGGLLAGDTLDVDDVLETVDGGDLALLVLVRATDDEDLVVFADGDAADLLTKTLSVNWLWLQGVEVIAYVVLLTQLLAERGAHDVPSDA